jgi:hypothetical protein
MLLKIMNCLIVLGFAQGRLTTRKLPFAIGGGGGVDYLACFSGSNLVHVQDKGAIPMGELQLGDFVNTGTDGTFSRVYSFAHKDHDAEVEYLQMYTDVSSTPMEISADHFLYVGSMDEKRTVMLMRAKDVKVGDWFGDKQVVSIQPIHRRGLYAPVTESGDIMVSGVVASCYASFLEIDPSAQAWAMHSILSLLRSACAMDFSICAHETYTEDGFSTNYSDVIQNAQILTNLGTPMQWFLLILLTPLLIGLLMLEQCGLWMVGALFMMGLVLAHRHHSSRVGQAKAL